MNLSCFTEEEIGSRRNTVSRKKSRLKLVPNSSCSDCWTHWELELVLVFCVVYKYGKSDRTQERQRRCINLKKPSFSDVRLWRWQLQNKPLFTKIRSSPGHYHTCETSEHRWLFTAFVLAHLSSHPCPPRSPGMNGRESSGVITGAAASGGAPFCAGSSNVFLRDAQSTRERSCPASSPHLGGRRSIQHTKIIIIIINKNRRVRRIVTCG